MKTPPPSGVTLVVLSLVLTAAGCATAPPLAGPGPSEGWRVSAPGGGITIRLALTELERASGKRLHYQVERIAAGAATVVMPWSPLGIRRSDQVFDTGLTFVRESDDKVVEDYELPHGKRRHYHNEGIQKTLEFRNPSGARLNVVFRVFNDGFGFRYHFPETSNQQVAVEEELTGFRFPADATATLSRHVPAWRDDIVAYESLWELDKPVGTPALTPRGWSFPALFASADKQHHILITESGLDETYGGTHLRAEATGGLYRIALPFPEEAKGLGVAHPVSTLPWTTPWRVVILGDLATIVQSSLVTDLAAPSVIADTSWVHAGRSSWSWWSENDSPSYVERINPFVDFAHDMGWEYSLVDAGWNKMLNGKWQDVVTHARPLKVGVWLWYNSGGPHSDWYGALPRDLMHLPDVRRAELKKIAAAGVRGIKVDFFNSDKQHVIKLYLDTLRDAAAEKLMVVFHGATLPRGWQRTYPNLMAHEAVLGAEAYRFNSGYAATAPSHNVVQVFTRNVVGSMDYTPVTFMQQKYRRVTSDAHELALAIAFESGVQHLADAPHRYRALPPAAIELLKVLPAAWDETRMLAGAVGDFVVIARRSGRDWFVAGLNGKAEPRSVSLPLQFLGPGEYATSFIGDGATGQRFSEALGVHSAKDTHVATMAPNGGFSLRLMAR